MRVVPEKADRCAYHGAAENRQLSHLWHTLQFQVGSKGSVTADISQHCQGAGGYHRAPNGQTIQAIGEIHGVAGKHYD